MLAKAFGTSREVREVEAIIRRNKIQGHTDHKDIKWMFDNIGKYFHKIRQGESVTEDRGFSSSQIKQAYGVLNDPRYKQGNYSGAVKAIEKIAKGLSDHPDVKNALKRANEDFRLKDSDVEKLKKGVKELPPIKLPFKFGKPEKVGVKKENEVKQESKKYHETKPGSIQDTIAQMQVNETKDVTVRAKELSAMVETYLNKGGVSKNLPPAINEIWPAIAGAAAVGAAGYALYKHVKSKTKSMRKPLPQTPTENKLPLQAVREFIDTYNRHFLTNFKAEEFIVRDRLEG